ncbi:MAG: O-acetyl-ADP-ribose deacetylase [Anaerolineaceae bacterium]|nr:O-acetyl-ADP-ribose deacetylase [Anaerolineaceae bacterium]
MTCYQINQTRLEIVQGDITNQAVDAIVNAANTSLLGGGGVDGAIHRAAGPELLEECQTLHGCKTGEAKITRGYHLPAKHVIHAVGPIYGTQDAPVLLASAYSNSLQIAGEHHLASVAFPAISTGIYGYPMREAARISLRAVLTYLENHTTIKIVRFILFTSEANAIYREELESIAAKNDAINPCE